MVAEIQAGVEYKVIKVDAGLEQTLNELAKQGWQVCGVTDKVVVLERR